MIMPQKSNDGSLDFYISPKREGRPLKIQLHYKEFVGDVFVHSSLCPNAPLVEISHPPSPPYNLLQDDVAMGIGNGPLLACSNPI
jgi:hypothetical protein